MEKQKCSHSSFGNLPISSPKCPADISHWCFSSAPTISVPKHFNQSFILNRKYKRVHRSPYCPGLAEVPFSQVTTEKVSLGLPMKPFPLGKLWFLVRNVFPAHILFVAPLPYQLHLCNPHVVDQRWPHILWHSSPWGWDLFPFSFILDCSVTALTNGLWHNWCHANSKSNL